MSCKYIYNNRVFNSELELNDFLLQNGKLITKFGDIVFERSSVHNKVLDILDTVTQDTKEAQEAYKKAKEIIDSYHREFIEKSLSSVNVDWNDLYSYLSKKEPEDYAQKQKFLEELENILLEKRKIIVKQFEQYVFGSYTDSKGKKTKDLKFENLFKSELFDYLLPNFLKNDEDKKVIGSFNKFTSYFTGFYENRKNLGSEQKIVGSIRS